MDTFDFVIIGAGPGRRGRGVQGARARGRPSRSIDRRWFGGSCPHIGCLPSKSLLDGAARHAREPGAVSTGRMPRPRATTWSTGRRTPPSPTIRATCARLREAGAVAYRGNATIAGPGPRRGQPRRGDPRAGRHERGRRGRLGVEASADRGPRDDPGLDEPPGDARPRAAGEPARPRRRADGLRDRPGLRAVRRPDDDRPVRPAARPDRPPAQLRGRARGARTRRRHDPDRGPRPARPGRGRARRRARHRAGRRLDRRGPRDPARGRPVVPARRPRARALRHRHDRSYARSRATAGCGSPTGCGSSAIRPDPSSTPTRPTTRASSRCAWRWASTVRPDYRALPRATYIDPEASSVGLTLDGALDAGLDAFELVADFAKSAKGYAIQAKLGHVTIVVDRRDARAGRRGDGLPGCVGRDPRVRRWRSRRT